MQKAIVEQLCPRQSPSRRLYWSPSSGPRNRLGGGGFYPGQQWGAAAAHHLWQSFRPLWQRNPRPARPGLRGGGNRLDGGDERLHGTLPIGGVDHCHLLPDGIAQINYLFSYYEALRIHC